VSLSDPSSAGDRWARLRRDIWEACAPLIPAQGKLVGPRGELEAALHRDDDTSSFELHRQVPVLKRLVNILGQLCAPLRDPEIRQLVATLNRLLDEPEPNGVPELVSASRSIIKLSEEMKGDLSEFKRSASFATLQSSHDPDGLLTTTVRAEAIRHEREAVLASWGGAKEVKEATRAWMAEKLSRPVPDITRETLGEAIVSTLFEDRAVALPNPPPAPVGPETAATTEANVLPPVLYVDASAIFSIQNRIQAACVLACLHALARATSSAWVERVASLLDAETDGSLPRTTMGQDSGTRLDNIADELVRAAGDEAGEEEKTRLREGVRRIVRYEDPVFRLLKKRLGDALVGWLRRDEGDAVVPPSANAVPSSMATGRLAPPSSVSRAKTSSPVPEEVVVKLGPVKGFDGSGPVRAKVGDIGKRTKAVLDWSWEVWREVLGDG
jgi:hypothetical protein